MAKKWSVVSRNMARRTLDELLDLDYEDYEWSYRDESNEEEFGERKLELIRGLTVTVKDLARKHKRSESTIRKWLTKLQIDPVHVERRQGERWKGSKSYAFDFRVFYFDPTAANRLALALVEAEKKSKEKAEAKGKRDFERRWRQETAKAEQERFRAAIKEMVALNEIAQPSFRDSIEGEA